MAQPSAVSIRAYQVGFGDCFLLTFHYPAAGRGGGRRVRDRHVLIDFGSTGAPRGFRGLKAVAESIREECGGKLHAVVATHRHRDHIGGFATDGDGPGTVIAACNPDVVVQPWTEDPDAQPDAIAATAATAPESGSRAFVRSLRDMHGVAEAILAETPRLAELLDPADLDDDEDEEEDDDGSAGTEGEEGAGAVPHREPAAAIAGIAGIAGTPGDAAPPGPLAGAAPGPRVRPLIQQLTFMGENNLPNRSAIDNLMTMGKRRVYVHAGGKSGLERVLPGVKVSVLGPPTLEQTETIRSQRRHDEAEFWHLQAQAGRQAASPAAERLFPKAPVLAGSKRPKWSRWLLPRLRGIRGEQLREIVRVLDKAMNNTSVILLFEVGKHKLLFPGDAQIESWQFALGQKRYRKLLRAVTFYKVGHHGSLNATPKSLWNGFEKRSRREGPGRLRTMVSTMKGKHGDPKRSTEVPRRPLVEALREESHFFTTQSIKAKDGLFELERIEL